MSETKITNYTTTIKKAYVIKEQEQSVIHEYQYNFVGSDDIIQTYNYELNPTEHSGFFYSPVYTLVGEVLYFNLVNNGKVHLNSNDDKYLDGVPTVENCGYQFDTTNKVSKPFGYTPFSGRVVGTSEKTSSDGTKYTVDKLANGYDYIDADGNIQSDILYIVDADEGTSPMVYIRMLGNSSAFIFNSDAECFLTSVWIKYYYINNNGNEVSGWVMRGNGMADIEIETDKIPRTWNTYNLTLTIT